MLASSIRSPLPTLKVSPLIGQSIYVLWDKDDSEELTGWYKATVEEYHQDGRLSMQYSCGSTEMVDISATQWRFARKNGRIFIPSDQPPPPQPKNATTNRSTQYIQGTAHKCKGFADDLIIIDSDATEHQHAI